MPRALRVAGYRASRSRSAPLQCSGPRPPRRRPYASPGTRCRVASAIYDVPMSETTPSATEAGTFLESLMDTELYSIGAFFYDEHPDLVDEVVARSEEIERRGLAAYSAESGGPVEESFETLLTGLAVRYYKAVAG